MAIPPLYAHPYPLRLDVSVRRNSYTSLTLEPRLTIFVNGKSEFDKLSTTYSLDISLMIVGTQKLLLDTRGAGDQFTLTSGPRCPT
jgi:hypothetical protein